MNNWKSCKITNLGKIVSGGTPNTSVEEYWNGKIPWITPKDMSLQSDKKYISNGERYISEEGLKKSSSKLLPKGSVLFTSRAPIGYLGIAINDICTNQGFKSIIVNEKNDNEFVYYLLKFSLNKIIGMAGGSTFKEINSSSFKKIEIKVPPLPTQHRIAAILSALDDKIENNRRICETLEQIAQAIFKRWFVDFDFPCLPQNYRPSGQVNLSDEFKSVMTYKRVGGLPISQEGKWFVYVLLCEDGSFYKGITKDLYRRFYEHYTGQGADWAKSHKPVKVIHYEIFDSQEEAAKREKDLKTGFGRTWLHREYEKLRKESGDLPALKTQIEQKSGGLPSPKTQIEQNSGGLPAPKTKLRQAGKMVESELGLIPEGWEINDIYSICNVIYGTPFASKLFNQNKEGLPIIRIRDLKTFTPQNYSLEKHKRATMINPGDILIGMDAEFRPTIWLGEKGYLNQRVCLIQPIKNSINKHYLYELLKPIMKFYENAKDGTTVSHLGKSDIDMIKVFMPNDKILEEFRKISQPVHERIVEISKENQILQQTRDTLLPKLMSGEMEV